MSHSKFIESLGRRQKLILGSNWSFARYTSTCQKFFYLRVSLKRAQEMMQIDKPLTLSKTMVLHCKTANFVPILNQFPKNSKIQQTKICDRIKPFELTQTQSNLETNEDKPPVERNFLFDFLTFKHDSFNFGMKHFLAIFDHSRICDESFEVYRESRQAPGMHIKS